MAPCTQAPSHFQPHSRCECVESLQRDHRECVESLQHDHRECVESLQHDIAYLQSERIAEQAKGRELVHMLVEEKARRDFCLDRFKSDDKKIRYYTGFVTYGMFEACFNFLLPSAKEMRTWQGKRTSTSERTTDKSGPKSKLPLQEQFFMVMVRLRLGLNVEDLADRFYVSSSTVSRIFITWINLMYVKFKECQYVYNKQLTQWMCSHMCTKLFGLHPCIGAWEQG